MGRTRSAATRSEARELPLTHRQQKRTRKSQTARPPSKQAKAHGVPMRQPQAGPRVLPITEPRPATVSLLHTATTTPSDQPIPVEQAAAPVSLLTIEDVDEMEDIEQSDEVPASEALAVAPDEHYDEPTAAPVLRTSQSAAVPAALAESPAAEEAIPSPASSGRKHPTLAVMAARAAHSAAQPPEPEQAPAPVEAMRQETLVEIAAPTEGAVDEPPPEMTLSTALKAILRRQRPVAVPIAQPHTEEEVAAGVEDVAAEQLPSGDLASPDLAAPGETLAVSEERERGAVQTQPVASIRLARLRPSLGTTREAYARPLAEPQPTTQRLHQPAALQPLPEPDLLLPIAATHAALAAAAALVGVSLLMANQSLAFWAVAFAAISGGGGGAAYLYSQRPDGRWSAGVSLLISQVGIVLWGMLVVGAHATFLTLVPAMVVLALRLVGRAAATITTAATALLYCVVLVLQSQGGLHPLVPQRSPWLGPIDALIVSGGMLLMLIALIGLQAGQAHALAMARARQHEVQQLRMRLATLRQQTEDDAALLQQTLAEALRGQGTDPIAAQGPLSLLAETIDDAADRLATLQRDREERLRLEGALHAVIRAVERSWLGLPWMWPEPSDTVLDELVALLRAPRPKPDETSLPGDTPGLVPIPNLTIVPRSGQRNGQAPISGTGWTRLPTRLRRRNTLDSTGAEPPNSPSRPRWSEWRAWSEWESSDHR